MKKKLLSMLAMCTLAAFVAVGCGSSADKNNASGNQEINQESNTKEDADSDATQDKDQDANQNSGQDEAEFTDRVIASSVAVVEILDALGIPMVGVPTSSYDLPESVADAARIGNPMSPDIEVIASLEPTVIVSVDSLSSDLAEQFEVLGAESYFVNLSSYDGLKETIAKLGERFNVEDKAAAMIADFDAREKAVAKAVEGKDAPSVLIIFGAGASFMTVSEAAYVGDLVKRAGGENIITDAPSAFAPVDMEYLADKNPEYILFMSHANPEDSLAAFKQEVEGNPAWQNFDAVKNDKLITLPTGYFGMSANLQAVDALEKLVDILYGEN